MQWLNDILDEPFRPEFTEFRENRPVFSLW